MSTLDCKLLPYTIKGTLDIGLATAMTFYLGLIPRGDKPYPPTAVNINGDFWPNGKTYTGDIELFWEHGNRFAMGGREIKGWTDAGPVAPEGFISFELKNEYSTTVLIRTGLTVKSCLLTNLVLAEAGFVSGDSLTFEIWQEAGDQSNPIESEHWVTDVFHVTIPS